MIATSRRMVDYDGMSTGSGWRSTSTSPRPGVSAQCSSGSLLHVRLGSAVVDERLGCWVGLTRKGIIVQCYPLLVRTVRELPLSLWPPRSPCYPRLMCMLATSRLEYKVQLVLARGRVRPPRPQPFLPRSQDQRHLKRRLARPVPAAPRLAARLQRLAGRSRGKNR
jgi:hypothetical protein